MLRLLCWLAVHAAVVSGIRLQGYDVIKPLWFLHLPKTGSSIINTIIGYVDPGWVSDARFFKPPFREPHQWQNSNCDAKGEQFCNHAPGNMCCGAKFASDFGYFQNGHAPLPTDQKPVWDKHVMMMAREPRSRLLSGYKHALHDCEPLQEKYHCKEQEWRLPGHQENCSRAPLLEYESCVRGCSANMLTGRACADRGSEHWTKVAAAAVDVVHNSVAFVGLTAHWPESVCLFHTRFGGRCYPEEFSNVRPGNKEASVEQQLPQNWGDATDQAVYEAAKERFWAEMARYKVTRDLCARSICPGVDSAIFDAAAFSKDAGPSRPPSKGASFKVHGAHQELEYDED